MDDLIDNLCMKLLPGWIPFVAIISFILITAACDHVQRNDVKNSSAAQDSRGVAKNPEEPDSVDKYVRGRG